MRIGVKITSMLVLVAVAGIIITALMSFVVAREGIEKRIGGHLESVATLKKYHLSSFIRERIHEIDRIANNNIWREVFLGGTKVEIRNIIKDELDNREDFIELFILNLDGTVHVSTDEKQEGKIKSYEKYSIAGKKGPFIQSFYYDLSLQQPSMTISAPIKDGQGSLPALLVGRINLKRVSDLMTERTGLGETGETYLVNKFNYLVTESRFEEGLALKKLISTEGVKDCLKGNNGLRMYDNYRGSPVIAFYEWIPEKQICLLAEVSQDEVFASINRLRDLLIVATSGIAILVIVFAFFFSKTISKPLENLIRGTELIGKGDLEHRVDVRTKDEIGKLALAFNDMTERRQEAEEELRKHRDRLEELVEERTVELKKANEELEHEIVARKKAEEVLRGSEEKYRTILENIEEGYYEVDLAGNLTFFNDSLCRITGSTRDELIGMNNREYMDQDTAKEVYRTFTNVYDTGKPTKGFGYEIKLKDGTRRNVESSVSLIKDAEGHRIGFRGIVQDVTQRKQMEAELIQTKNFLQSILDSSIDGITATDLHGTVTYTTPKVKDILGYEQGERIGKKVSIIYGNGKEDAKAITKELTAKGELRDHEMRLARKDGELIDINLSASLLRDERGEVIGTLGIYRDITEKKRLEAQLAQAQRMEALGTLAGGIAHNFNNLLMAIQGNASLMLLDTNSTHPSYERLKNIEKSVQNGSRLTRQLLGYAREGRYEIKPISLNQLVEETSITFGSTKKHITVHRDLVKDLWGITADQGQIEQVLLNLYVNAADAMPGGGELFLKTMNATHRDMKNRPYEAKPGEYVLVTIRDTGTGMDKKTMERIFDPFFTTKGLARGTGLGLASVYGTVKAHGGYIDVDSKKGQGSTFTIYLPASEETVEKRVKGAEHIVEGAGTILLVDDEEMVLDVGAQLLKALGYTVLEARGGTEAVEVYRENKDKIDMVLLDMIMPDMGGGEAYDTMKEINPDIKVLLSSGYDIDGKAREILERGCDAFIQKPFTMRELSGRIREILDAG